MRWSIIILIALGLGCSKKQEPATTETEQAAEAESPAVGEAPEAAAVMADPEAATDFKVEDLPPLPPELEGQAPLLDAPPLVNVLERGSEPRQELRWRVESGLEQPLTATLGIGVDAVIVLIRSKMPLVESAYDLTMRAKKVRKDGTVQVGFHVTGVEVVVPEGAEPKQTEAQKLAMQERAKVVGSYTLSPRGGISDFKLAKASDGTQAGPGLVDLLRWSLGQMTPALPAEPVGVGAKWSAHESMRPGRNPREPAPHDRAGRARRKPRGACRRASAKRQPAALHQPHDRREVRAARFEWNRKRHTRLGPQPTRPSDCIL